MMSFLVLRLQIKDRSKGKLLVKAMYTTIRQDMPENYARLLT